MYSILTWNSTDITTKSDIISMVHKYKQTKPTYGAFDTETDGLHIKLCTPFLFQFGWYNEKLKQGWTYAVDLERNPEVGRQTVLAFWRLAKSLSKLFGHNVKYDLHMMDNVKLPYPHKNISDSQIYIRFAHDSITDKQGGVPLALKKYAARHITKDARFMESEIHAQRTKIAQELNKPLYKMFKNFGPPKHMTKSKSWGKGAIVDFFKDKTRDEYDFPYEGMTEMYLEWYSSLPEQITRLSTSKILDKDDIPYNMVDRDLVIKYGHLDIVYTLETIRRTEPVALVRKQEKGIKIEEDVIIPLYKQESYGFLINKEYIMESKVKMKNYIHQRRNSIYNLAGREFKINSPKVVKELLTGQFGLDIESTDKEELKQTKTSLIRNKGDKNAIAFIDTLLELRTLEKWYSTYLVRLAKELELTDRVYTSFKQVGAVSLRQSSNFQQFPKKGIKTVDGDLLFHPRKAINCENLPDSFMFYLDYSQIELRVQAFYTILVGGGDLNLCRAYMPYKCFRYTPVKEEFDYKNKEHIKAWNSGEWYLNEDEKTAWHPVDLHGATAKEAIPGLTEKDPKFEDYRGTYGKRLNFSKNYGAGIGVTINLFPDLPMDQIEFIDGAYYRAFPGIKPYHNYCYEIVAAQGYASSLFGSRYYGMSGHHLINYLIQGTAAQLLKVKITEMQNYLDSIGCKTFLSMNIHDEVSGTGFKDEIHIIAKLKEIMEDFEDWWIPIVADLEISTTNWAEKKGCTVHELERIFS